MCERILTQLQPLLGGSAGTAWNYLNQNGVSEQPPFSFKYLPDGADNEPMEPYEAASEANPSHRQLCRSQWKLIPLLPRGSLIRALA